MCWRKHLSSHAVRLLGLFSRVKWRMPKYHLCAYHHIDCIRQWSSLPLARVKMSYLNGINDAAAALSRRCVGEVSSRGRLAGWLFYARNRHANVGAATAHESYDGVALVVRGVI